MRRKIGNLISVGLSAVRMVFLKLFAGKAAQVSLLQRFSPNVILELDRGGRLTLEKLVRVHSGSKISVRSGGRLEIGSNVRMNYNCMVVCHREITIGRGTELGPNVLIYDHDHDFRHPAGFKSKHFKTSPVHIGENVWLGANVVILRGTTIGDNCVVGAGSVLSGNYPANSVIVQKRQTQVTGIRSLEAE